MVQASSDGKEDETMGVVPGPTAITTGKSKVHSTCYTSQKISILSHGLNDFITLSTLQSEELKQLAREPGKKSRFTLLWHLRIQDITSTYR